MSRSLERRVQALEAESPASWAASAADEFWRAVANAKGNFGPYDSELTVAQRIVRFTPLEHLAWQLNFTGEADLEAILALYGETPPEIWTGWVLLLNWMPGD
ncbi:hypothetical protein [Erythrobacter alti]|uniref:hypothetical protein n=1 Tax=Erythrobacter alti TaxID=1896145 RepID=UPI0030F4A2C1